MKKIFYIPFFFLLIACSTTKLVRRTAIADLSNSAFKNANPNPNYEALGDTLKVHVFRTTLPLRKKVGRQKKMLIYSGTASTAAGIVSTTAIGMTSSDSDKRNWGYGISISTSLIGIIQLFAGSDKSANDYVTECTDAIGQWDLSSVKDKDAFYAFRKSLIIIQQKFPEYATFQP